jgi:CheY-like chemotaxis protein/anti-sigma regulatory factor (Ser/Thr protein kinase)
MKKILVIDDADFILESTSTLLKFEGYEVVTAPNGRIGVEVAKEQKPNLILCDISMPELDGYGVLDELRGNPETTTTPFIFLTAFTEKQNMRIGMEKGADDFLVKPFTREELIAAIEAQWKKTDLFEEKVDEKFEEFGRNITNALPHEFRTVLNQVIGSAKFLQSNKDNISADEISELSDDIISSSQRLIKITENYLVYAKIESFKSNKSKRQQLRNNLTDEPAALLSDIAYHVAGKYQRTDDLEIKGIVQSISIEIASESYHKVLEELFDNAFKFSEPGTIVDVDISMIGSNFNVSIEDKGRGMTPEQIKNVGAYKQFERTVYEQQGVGLGLSIAKKLVDIHDGMFQIDSKLGEGTKITFSLHLH